MRATFDHSWNLLTEQERGVLCQLSVFRGGFDRRAAEYVSGASLPILASLVSKSLVRRAESGRHDLHEVIRQYAAVHLLEQPGNLEAHNRHCDYYLSVLRDRGRELRSASQRDALRELILEIDNLRAALSWATRHKRFDGMEQALRALGWLFESAGLLPEGMQQFSTLIQALFSMTRSEASLRLLGLALAQQSLIHFRRGDFEQAEQMLEESLDVLRPLGDQTLLTDSLLFLGIIRFLNGDLANARTLISECLGCARAGGDHWFEAYAIYNLGHIASLEGRYEEGYEAMMTGLSMWRASSDPQSISLGLNFLVPTMVKLGMHDQARQFMQESLMLCEKSANRWGMGTALRHLGLIELDQGDLAQAQTLFLKSLETFEGFIIGWDVALSLMCLGEVKMAEGDLRQAEELFVGSLRISLDAKTVGLAFDALVGLAQLRARTDQHEMAFIMSSYTVSQSAPTIQTRTRAQQIQRDAQRNMTPGQLEAATLKVAEQTTATISEMCAVLVFSAGCISSASIGRPIPSRDKHKFA